MEIKNHIDLKIRDFLKAKDEKSLSLFRMLKSVIKNAEIEKKEELNDAEVIQLLEKQAKQRRDSIEQFTKGGRGDLAEKEIFELKIIESFLPKKLSEDDIKTVIKEILSQNPSFSFGQIMSASMQHLKGKADGQVVQEIVREEMGK